MNTRIYLVIFSILLMTSLFGCVFFTNPPNNVGFDDKADIRKFVGLYRNLGESSKLMEGPFYLSKIIWNSDNELKHSEIETIEVSAVNDKTIKIKAFTKQKVFKEAEFSEGTDFSIVNGRIRILRETGLYKDRSVMVGPYSEKAEIGIDQRGDGKYSYVGGGAGLLYLFIPIAAVEGYEVRFVRIKN